MAGYMSSSINLLDDCIQLHGHRASEADGDGSIGAEHGNQTFNGSPGTHAAACKAQKDVDECDGASDPSLLISSHPSLQAVIVPDCLACGRVEALAWKLGSLVDDAADVHHAGEGVCKVHHEDGTDQADNTVEVGHCTGDDEGEDPIAGSQDVPKDLALLLNDRRELEDRLEHFEVHRLHTDVEVHDDGNPTGKQSEDVTGSLKAIWINDIHNVVGRVLTVERVDEDTEKHVDNADKGLGHEHALPEVQRVPHLREEGDEEESASVCVDHSIHRVERSSEAWSLLLVLVWWNTSKDLDGLDSFDERRPGDRRVIRREVCSSHHTVVMLVSKLRQ